MDLAETSVCAPGSPPYGGIEQELMEVPAKGTKQLHSNVSSMIAVSALLLWGSAESRTEGTGSYSTAQGGCMSSARRMVGWHPSMLPEAVLTGTGRLGSS